MAAIISRIAVDAMGGDHYPDVPVAGSIEAVVSFPNVEVTLVGDEKIVAESLDKLLNNSPEYKKFNASAVKEKIKIVHADEIIEMTDSPARAIRSKKNSSLVVANRLCNSKVVDAVISAGNTGAAMTASLLFMGRLHGVLRPSLLTHFPSQKKIVALTDVGANTDCRPEHLYQFGVMASIYVSRVLGYDNPRVGLLNIGEERNKGNEVTGAAFELFEKSTLNFIGNVEGRDILKGNADVVVCDGFVGNIILKFGESTFGFLVDNLKRKISGSLIKMTAASILKPVFKDIKREMTPEEYGGALLIGVDGISIICHGNSSPTEIKNAIKISSKLISDEVNEMIKNEFKEKSRINDEQEISGN